MSIKIILRSFFFPICILFGICGYTQNGNRVRVFYDTETGTMKRIASRIEDTIYVKFDFTLPEEVSDDIRKTEDGGAVIFSAGSKAAGRTDEFLFDATRGTSGMRKLSLKEFRRLKFAEISALDSLPDIKSKVINIVEISDKGDTVLYRNVSWEMSDFIYPIKRVAPPGYVPDKDALKDTVYVKFDFKSLGKMTSERIHKFKNRGKIIFCVGEETMGRMDEFLFDTVRRASDMRKLSLKEFRRLKFREVFVLDTLPDIKYRRIHVVEVPEEGDTLLYRNVRWERVFYTE